LFLFLLLLNKVKSVRLVAKTQKPIQFVKLKGGENLMKKKSAVPEKNEDRG